MAEITAAGGQAFAMAGDMTDEGDVAALVARAVAEFGGIDIVVPVTGGIVARVPVAQMTADHWRQVMDLNATSAFLLIRAAVPHLRDGGAIVTCGCCWSRPAAS